MTGRRLTDDQISKALRAHLPDRAAPGLRDRILDAAETTGQQRALPSFLGALSDADPVVRRRSILLAAALLLALALASAAASGALRLLQRDPIRDLSLLQRNPVEDVRPQAAHRRRGVRPVQLRPDAAAAAGRDDEAGRRLDQEPDLRRSVGGRPHRAVRVGRCDGARHVHHPQRQQRRIAGDRGVREGLGRQSLRPSAMTPGSSFPTSLPRPRSGSTGRGCDLTRNPDEAGNGTAAAGWRYVGIEAVAGRRAHHVTCDGARRLAR